MDKKSPTNKELLNAEPDKDSSIVEWREWALELKERYFQMLETESNRRKRINTLRRDVAAKDRAIRSYKQTIAELEQVKERRGWLARFW